MLATWQNIIHMKLYGNSAVNMSSGASTIIENPELLKLQEEEKIQQEKSLPKKRSEVEKFVCIIFVQIWKPKMFKKNF